MNLKCLKSWQYFGFTQNKTMSQQTVIYVLAFEQW